MNQRDTTTDSTKAYRVDLVFMGANPEWLETTISGGVFNFLFPSPEHPDGFQGVPTYKKATYHHLYEGIDLVCHNLGSLHYEFMISPDADPLAINVDCEGATDIQLLDEAQLLEIQTPLQSIYLPYPTAYQWVNGVRNAIDVAYSISNTQLGFSLGEYDPSLPLTIQISSIANPVSPIYTGNSLINHWTTFVNSVPNYGSIEPYDITTRDNNIYITGACFDISIPNHAGSANQVYQQNSSNLNAFAMMFNNLRDIQWFTIIGGTGNDWGTALGLSNSILNTIYVTGITESYAGTSSNSFFFTKQGNLDFTHVSSAPQTGIAESDMFLLKLNATDGSFGLSNSAFFSTLMGSKYYNEMPTSIAVEQVSGSNSERVYIGGTTEKGSYWAGGSPHFAYFSFGPTGTNGGVAGTFYLQDLYNVSGSGNRHSFLLQMLSQPSGGTSQLKWLTGIDALSNSKDGIIDLKLKNQELYVLGISNNTASAPIQGPIASPPPTGEFPLVDPNLTNSTEFIRSHKGNGDAYILKFNSSRMLVWSTMLGGNQEEMLDMDAYLGSFTAIGAPLPRHKAGGIEVDNEGNIYIAGNTASVGTTSMSSTFFPIQSKTNWYNSGTTNKGNYDGFFARFTPQFALDWSSFYGSTQRDFISDITLNGGNTLYSVGNIKTTAGTLGASINFPLKNQSGAYYKSVPNGRDEGFIVKMGTSGVWAYSSYYGSTYSGSNLNMQIEESMVAVKNSSDDAHLFFTGGGTNYGATTTIDAFPLQDLPGTQDYFDRNYYSGNLANIYVADFLDYCTYCERSAAPIEELLVNNLRLAVFPNPSQGRFLLHNPEHLYIEKVELLDNMGRVLQSQTLENDADQTEGGMEGLASGVYFLRVYAIDKVQNITVIIQ